MAPGAAALFGAYWSATEGAHVIYESRLELARLLYADFDPSVRHIVAQPFLLTDNVAGAGRKHVPDFFLVTNTGPVVVDVKPASKVSEPKVSGTLGWTRSAVEGRGWTYEVWTEPPSVELRNMRFLAGFRRSAHFDDRLLCELRAAGLDNLSLGEAGRRISGWPVPGTGGTPSPGVVALLRRGHVPRPVAVASTGSGRISMSGAVRIGVGTKVVYDGDLAEVVELQRLGAGTIAVLRDQRGRMLRVSLATDLTCARYDGDARWPFAGGF